MLGFGLLSVALGARRHRFRPGPLGLGEVLAGADRAGRAARRRRSSREIRAPRVALAAAVGAGLALSGTTLQGVLRNPLADPGLIGVTAGGALGAVRGDRARRRVLGVVPAACGPG